MQGYNVHENLYLDCEINGPWIRRSSPKAWQMRPNSENVLILKKIVSVLLLS